VGERTGEALFSGSSGILGANVGPVRCPWCLVDDDRVVDSRTADEGEAIRRRRECQGCGGRFTTFERVEEAPIWVMKRSGQREPFDRAKVITGLRAATKNRPVSSEQLDEVARQVEESLRERGSEIDSQEVGLAVLDLLRFLDEVAYVRFASVYKGFEDLGDFRREMGLLTKTTAPKLRG
jgi:transcriptional repressor NrdR